ncbi:MAG: hypothetical protein HKN20_17275, partial [Gemmatimonadetes bacterium]|nr:hypothetical protein [Gemmatimonadota bacterium]
MGNERAWITLHHKPLSGIHKKELIEECGTPEAVLDLTGMEIARITEEKSPAIAQFRRTRVDCARIERSMRKHGIEIIPFTHEHYPPLLREIPDAPALLYALGDTSVLTRRSLSIVGS